jgi:hypothetical protein
MQKFLDTTHQLQYDNLKAYREAHASDSSVWLAKRFALSSRMITLYK